MAGDDGDEMTGEFAVSEATVDASTVGEHADKLRERFAVAAIRQSTGLSGDVAGITPEQAMAQIAESLNKAVGRMDDVSLEMESTIDGTRFKFRAYRR